MRFKVYAGVSATLAAVVVARALHVRANFYSAAVYVAHSNAALMILTNLLLLIVGAVMLGLQKLLYGPLRPIEVEQLYEKAWFAVTETCLAMTIFREEVGGWFIVMFVSLLIGKVWGWIGEGRLEILEQQPPANPRLFHARLTTSLLLSFVFDLYFLKYSILTVAGQARPSMMVMFAFEFAVLSATSFSTCCRYCISLWEASVIRQQTTAKLQEQRDQVLREREERRRQAEQAGEELPEEPPIDEVIDELDIDVPGWEEKGRWVFYLDLATDFIKLMLYLCFFAVLCIFYGMPIHIIRDVALTIRSFYKRITDFMRYRHATRDMNERYPDATVEDIGNEDICIVCREGMRSWQPTQNVPNGGNDPVDERQRPKKLPCGHVLHFACLRSWLERQQLCPTCRQPVLATTPPTSAGVAPNANQQAGQRAQPDPAPGPAQGQGNQPQGEAGQRIRYFNLGPIRLGFGAGPLPRGFDPLNRNQPRAGGAPHDAARAGLAQQMGFPFNLGRPQNTNNSGPLAGQSAAGGVQDQLRAIEQTLMQEINGLQLQVHQLGLVSALQAELARLRAQQADPNSAAPLPTSSTTSIIPQIPSIHAYTQNGSQPGLRQGDSGFPPGMTIPDGWTLLPLQRSQPTMPAPSTSNPNPFSSTGPPQAPPSINTPNVHRSTPAEGSQSQPPSSLSTTIPSLAPGLSHEARENNRILPRQRDPRTAPSASEIPQWSSDWHGQNRERATESARTTQADPRVEAGSSSTRQRLDKGKGVAATVEDADNEASDTDTDSEL